MHNLIHTQWGQLPAVRLQHASGAHALITLYGAHLVEWRSSDGIEHLFCSELSSRDGSKAIRGGVPLIFPQFAAQGSGMRHGFARVSQWRLLPLLPTDQTEQACELELELSAADLAPAIGAAWPHAFALRLRIRLTAQALSLYLQVDNHGTSSFDFAAALHSYWQVAELAACRIEGLPATTEPLAISDKIDRIYQQSTMPLTLRDGAQQLQMQQEGFCDTVVWNPGALDCAALADMADEEYRRFVCIEAAAVKPITLTAGASWLGRANWISST